MQCDGARVGVERGGTRDTVRIVCDRKQFNFERFKRKCRGCRRQCHADGSAGS